VTTLELALGLILLMTGLVWLGLRMRATSRRDQGPFIPHGVTIEAQPVLTEAEAAFYNLLRLAVQDRYLVFAQVPVWCLLSVQAADRKARAAFMNRIALKRVDFVLVHPGTLRVAKVVELEGSSHSSLQKLERNRLIDEILKQGGIELVRVNPQGMHTVPDLAALLGMAEED
jgi:hypothetical protein